MNEYYIFLKSNFKKKGTQSYFKNYQKFLLL